MSDQSVKVKRDKKKIDKPKRARYKKNFVARKNYWKGKETLSISNHHLVNVTP